MQRPQSVQVGLIVRPFIFQSENGVDALDWDDYFFFLPQARHFLCISGVDPSNFKISWAERPSVQLISAFDPSFSIPFLLFKYSNNRFWFSIIAATNQRLVSFFFFVEKCSISTAKLPHFVARPLSNCLVAIVTYGVITTWRLSGAVIKVR